MLHQVGVGALGPVFRTYEPTRDRLVAVKVFRLDVTPEQAQALADELSVAAEAGLFHPSIVEPVAAGVEGTVAYRAEEYVAAETLDVALRHDAPAPIDKVLPLVTQLAGAIDFARTAGVGHGALHPRDVFVAPDEARATGFGVVEALERVGLRAPVRRPYSAPERVGGASWGTPADVFSLAAIAYELLTGRRPAGTGSQIGAVTGSTAGHHPGAVLAVFVQAMDEDPARRYQTALAFAAAIDAAARGLAPVATGYAGPVGAAGGLGMAAAPDDSDEDAGALPPLDDLDVRMEPAHADPEEELLRAEESDVDDAAENDEAYAALLADGETPAAGAGGARLLFDDEAEAEAEAEQEETRFADEFGVVAAGGGPEFDDVVDLDALPEEEPDPVDAASADYGAAASAPALDERRRPAMLPVAVGLVLALLIFAAGYAAGTRSPDVPVIPGPAEGTVGGAQAPDSAKPYSEEAVTPAPPPASVQPTPPAEAAVPRAEPAPESSSAPPAPGAETTAAPTGRLVIRSTPSGANVSVDGRWRGRTPLTLADLPLGPHQVRVVQPGYRVGNEDVSLSARTRSRTLSFRLQRSAPAAASPRAAAPPRAQASQPQSFTGTVYVDSRPRGATVLIDGKAMGVTPVRIPDVRIGSHIIRLQLADHSDWTTSTRVVAGQESRVTGSLERIQ